MSILVVSHVVSADIPYLLGLQVPYAEKLLDATVLDRLKKRTIILFT